jgi:ATP-dependent Clp protease ATP-binding subunit ClpA
VTKNEDGKDVLGFEYLDGPVTPKPEKIPARRQRAKRSAPRKPKPSGPKGGGSPGRGSVPKVPLVKA